MKKFFLFIFCFLNFNTAHSEISIAYIDINNILNNSIVGKSISQHIDSIKKNKLNEFSLIEEKLSNKEKNILAKKNILEKNDFTKEIETLRAEITKYANDKKKFSNEINEKKIKYTKIVLNSLNDIIGKYVEDNKITAVFSKKNIVVAKKNLDITDSIMNILNNTLTKIEF